MPDQTSSFAESPVVFGCAGESLVGIIATPSSAAPATGVVILVGGPQYRAGSHRQFLLLARSLATAGYASLRFDFRGMGDSSGDQRSFEQVTPDIGTAIDTLLAHCPSLQRIVLWGLCDAASAALLYVHETGDRRIGGICLLNPWVRSEASLARAQVKHYYGQRLLDPAFWKKLARGEVGIARAATGLLSTLHNLVRPKPPEAAATAIPFQQRMRLAIDYFAHPVLLILSENDYTAKEFIETLKADPAWQQAIDRPQVERIDVAGADHTFSSAEWRRTVEHETQRWLAGTTRLA